MPAWLDRLAPESRVALLGLTDEVERIKAQIEEVKRIKERADGLVLEREKAVEAAAGQDERARRIRFALMCLEHGVELLAQARAGLRVGGERVELAGDLLQRGPLALAGRAAGEMGAECGGFGPSAGQPV